MSKIALSLLLCLPLLGQRAERVRHVFGADEPLTAADSRSPSVIAQEYLRTFAQDLSLSEADLAAAYVAKEYRTAHNGVTHLIFRQRFQGVDIVNAEWVVNIDRDGRVLNAGGDLYAAPSNIELPTPASSRAAVRAAVKAANPKLGERFPALESQRQPRKSNGIRYEGGGLPEDVEGELVWHASEGVLRPAWAFAVLNADGVTRYATVIEDGTQALLEMRPLTYYQSTPRGMVFERESPQPNPTPGVRLTDAPPLVPRTMQPFQGDPVASSRGWVTGGESAGNNVVAGENLLGTSFLLTPRTAQAANGDFSFPLLLGPDMPNPLNYGDAATANLFYWMNRAHDLHYLSGFDEAAGNFQVDNFGRGGVGNDPIYAYSHYGAEALTAGLVLNSSFSSRGPDDGSESTVRMYLSAGIGSAGDFFTDGSYDSQVMVHEYTHGVSTRLVRLGYNTFQGASMGEAWSDFFGLEYTLADGAPPDGIFPIGQYFDQTFGFGGGRTRPYSTNLDLNPLSYADLGHVITFPEVHADGEIWVEALWEARANLIKQFGEKEGRRRVRLLVIDGMKLSPPPPSMVDMRDAILLADRVDFKGASQDQLWAGFAKRGLGALAYSSSGDTAHVISSFELPSTTGSMRFYDNPIVQGEQIRVVLQDSNYSQPTVRIQLTSGAGDLEDLILHRVGSIYTGAMSSSANTLVAKFDGILSLTPGDQVTAYYVDADAGGSARLISTSIDTMLPYFLSTSTPAFTFANERALNIFTSSRITLPFEFPFFTKKYSSALVYRNGLIAFEVPVSTACTDSSALTRWNAIAPLWLNLSTTGTAQPMENVYMSSTPDSVTFRWAAETVSQFFGVAGSPVNFAATLFADGRIEYHYGAGNGNLTSSITASGCSPNPAIGISNGHGVYALTTLFASLNNSATLHVDPPFNNSSAPVGNLESPAPDQRFQDILQVTGVAYDSAVFVSRIDVFIDGVQRTRLSANLARPDFCSGQSVRGCPNVGFSAPLNLASMGLAPGAHTLSARVTNSRGASFDFPDTPVNFFMDPGQSRLPFGGIDNHADGDIVSGVLTIQGYAADDDLRILSVDTLIDGVTYGPTQYGLAKVDVCANLTSKPPNCPNAGFRLVVNTLEAFPPVPDGVHTLQIRARDETGRLTLLPETLMHINVANGAAVPITGVLTSPSSNDHLTGTVQISGYAYSPGRRIIAATLVVDGSSYVAIPYGTALPDVCAQLPDVAACPRIGFAVNFDTTRLLNGPHVLGVLLRNDRGDSITIPQLDNGGINVFVDNP
jgi:Fungalysin metallopeptidase (M36)/Fungalysin/Thermolysin Propeptide Motif